MTAGSVNNSDYLAKKARTVYTKLSGMGSAGGRNRVAGQDRNVTHLAKLETLPRESAGTPSQ